MDLTVIVCTYNRAVSLANTLASLERQVVPKDATWEAIVVNNNSTDETEEVIEKFKKKGDLPLQSVFERQQGISYARNVGIRRAAGRIFAFTDDDCIADSNWVAAILEEFRTNPSLFGIGGRVELYDKRDRPVTIRPFKDRISFASTGQLFQLFAGCNMAFRRRVFEEIGGFDPHFSSVKALVAEDQDLVYRAFKQGFQLLYTPDVLVYHNHGRRTDAQVKRLNRSYIRGRGGFYCKHIFAGDRDIVRMAYWETRFLLKDSLTKARRMEWPREEAWVFRNLVAGSLSEMVNKCSFSKQTLHSKGILSPSVRIPHGKS